MDMTPNKPRLLRAHLGLWWLHWILDHGCSCLKARLTLNVITIRTCKIQAQLSVLKGLVRSNQSVKRSTANCILS